MTSDGTERLHRVLRGLISGADPGHLLHEALTGAVTAAQGTDGLLLAVIEGSNTPLASTGAVPAVVLDAAEAAISAGRLARRNAGGAAAVAEPLRVGTRVVGALAVGGDPRTLDALRLPLFADCASLALARRPSASATSAPEILDAAARVAAGVDRASILVRLFDTAEQLFGARAGFCAVFEGDVMRIPHYRGIDLERLRAAARHPEFKALLAAPDLRVDASSHPVVRMLGTGNETAVGVPLVADGRRLGHLVLLLEEAPDNTVRALLTSFSGHVALALRSADLYRRLGDKEEQLASVVHTIANPMIMVDEAGRFLLVNGSAAELFHIAGPFEVGQSVAGKLGDRDLEAMLAGDSEGEIEVTLGSPVPHVYRASVQRVLSSGGRTLGRVVVLDDITRERETDQIKANFVAVIGHELRTPLTIMKGYTRTLLRRGATIDDATRELALHSIDDNADRLERLIEDLLMVSSIASRNTTVHLLDEDLGAVIAEAVSVGGERVRVTRSGAGVVVPMDRAKVAQILRHLLDNGLKYSEGEVVVEVVERADEVEISVSDEGPGIFSGDVPQLFERFRQLDDTSTRAHGGTGLGLYICRQLVEAHGGRIWCDSRLGIGSRFAFALPRSRHASASVPSGDVHIDEAL